MREGSCVTQEQRFLLVLSSLMITAVSKMSSSSSMVDAAGTRHSEQMCPAATAVEACFHSYPACESEYIVQLSCR